MKNLLPEAIFSTILRCVFLKYNNNKNDNIQMQHSTKRKNIYTISSCLSYITAEKIPFTLNISNIQLINRREKFYSYVSVVTAGLWTHSDRQSRLQGTSHYKSSKFQSCCAFKNNTMQRLKYMFFHYKTKTILKDYYNA